MSKACGLHAIFCFIFSVSLTRSASSDDARIYWPKDYERSVAKWQEITLEKNPPRSRPNTGSVPFWGLKWHVYLENGQVAAVATPDRIENHAPIPAFDPRWKGHESASNTWVAAPVEDGWIVAFDVGEFGAGVVWFSPDGTKQYEISGDYVQTFLARPDGLFGQGGLSHLGFDAGALFKFNRAIDGRWHIAHLTDLKSAFCPIAGLRDGNLLIDVDGSLYSYSSLHGLNEYGPKGLPLPIQVSVIDTKLYCGGRYAVTTDKFYVASAWTVTEIDLHNLARRVLVPDSRFTNDVLRLMVSGGSAGK